MAARGGQRGGGRAERGGVLVQLVKLPLQQPSHGGEGYAGVWAQTAWNRKGKALGGRPEGRRWAPSPGHHLSHPPSEAAQALPEEPYVPRPSL